MSADIDILNVTMSRIAWVFHKPVHEIKLSMKFDQDLKAARVSDFSENEYDIILADINEAQSAMKNWHRGVINTVGEFYILIQQYYASMPRACSQLRLFADSCGWF